MAECRPWASGTALRYHGHLRAVHRA